MAQTVLRLGQRRIEPAGLLVSLNRLTRPVSGLIDIAQHIPIIRPIYIVDGISRIAIQCLPQQRFGRSVLLPVVVNTAQIMTRPGIGRMVGNRLAISIDGLRLAP